MNMIEVGAYYFPNFHVDPRNEKWHGKGWTEWELVQSARPRFPGHRQPIVPAWGHFDEADPQCASREIDYAADNGLTTFLYDWYWYEDGPYLQRQLHEGFLKAPNNGRMKFALMWANHTWTNIHPAMLTNPKHVLAKGEITLKAFDRMTDHVVNELMTRPNYLRLDGGAYFSIYEVGTFLRSMGGPDGARRALDRFRDKARRAGVGDLHLNGTVWGFRVLPTETFIKDPAASARDLGFASVTTYAWVHHYDTGAEAFPKATYARAADANYAAWAGYREQFPIPYHPNVSVGWDPSPRCVQTDTFENRGYPWMAVLDGNTPAAFEAALVRAKAFAETETRGQPMVTVNAWNEWTEGSYLLPDTHYGDAYARAIAKVFRG